MLSPDASSLFALRIGAREMLVYYRRLAEAAEDAGLAVLSPGA